VSGNGILAYRKGGTTQTQLAWYGRDGKPIGETVAAGKDYLQINLSPDEKQAVVHVANGIDHSPEIWLIDLLRGVPSRFTFGSSDSDPIWSPDGQRIVFTSRRKLQANLFWKATNGNGSEDLLLDAGVMTTTSDWSKDGKYIAYLSGPEPGKQDIYALRLSDKKTISVLTTKFNKDGVRFSPDGRWIAFHSNPTGMMEVYVTTFPASEKIWQISNGGGAQSRWRADGKELFYLTLDGKLMSVDLEGGAELNPRAAKMLFQSRVPVQHQIDQYAVSADGRRFLMIIPTGNPESVPITVVLNWK
jgi:Tol biopolymer transport system component